MASFSKILLVIFLLLLPAALVHSQGADEGKKKTDFALSAFDKRMNGQSARARELLEISIFIDSERGVNFFELARLNYYLGQYNAAYNHIVEAARIEPENRRFLYWKGVITQIRNASLYRVNRRLDPKLTTEAKEALQKALKLEPDYHEARFKLIEILVRLRKQDGGDPQAAADLAGELEKRDPGWGALAWAHTIIPGRSWEEVLPRIEKVLAEDPDNPGALLAKAKMLITEREMEKAAPVVERIVSLDKARSSLYLPLASCFKKEEDWNKGEAWIRKYIDFPGLSRSEKALGYMHLSNIYIKSKDDEAISRLKEKARALDPNCWEGSTLPPLDLFRPPVSR